MDPAIAALDFVQAGAIIANMIESYLAAGAPPLNAEGADHAEGIAAIVLLLDRGYGRPQQSVDLAVNYVNPADLSDAELARIIREEEAKEKLFGARNGNGSGRVAR